MTRNVTLLIFIMFIAVNAFSQLTPSPTPVQGTLAATLPVSGRNPQNGSVTAIQTPIPGTTTSVNTINPAIQVQGPYTGSTPSTRAAPFSGKLSLADAMERGLGYNLGPIGL